ncbi:MAG: DNA polymerase IV [Corynebacterium sp.]|uniref:DNA polymerase IV n=1 Tax=Corynebacterium sp. TaxID=1720 RepID=UPI0026E0D3E0|nr:DNA polymerase IV [Corynebacterium sp.]MDO5668836.1 DNA polymerase IV [Corynebacterium sp.]
MTRWVLHIDMDAFYASVEQLTRPTLRGRPVLVAGVSGRGVVAGASYEARKFGARSAMPTHQAARLVGFSAVLVAPRRPVYAAASRRVFQLIASRVAVVEQLSIDEAFMEPEELIGATPAEVQEWADELRRLIREETGLPSSIGAGTGKQFAKIGSGRAKPDGTFIIPGDRQLEILHPMPVNELWGVGPVTEAKLAQIGVTTIGDLAALSLREVEISLGTTIGPALWQLAHGIDERPVEPRAEAKSISAEYTYPRDLTTHPEVDAAITRAAEAAHRRLLIDGRGSRTITVKLKMADFRIESRSLTLPYATDNLETLQAMAFRLARYPDQVGPIRLVGVGYSGLETARQDVLFPELDQQVVVAATDDDFETGVSDHVAEPVVEVAQEDQTGWKATQDVYHPEFGHGWVQGTGHGIVSVRFETRATGPGRTHTFDVDDPELVPADPLDSLAWEEWLAEQDF